MKLKGLFAAIVLLAAGLNLSAQAPDLGFKKAPIKWSARTSQDTLIVSATISDTYVLHPASSANNGIELELSNANIIGSPIETYQPTDYKGEQAAVNSYELKQRIESKSTKLEGTIRYQLCQGDNCFAPEYYDFSIEAPKTKTTKGLLALIIEAILWGLAMLLTPCVFPMVPMTVSFFMRGSENKTKAKLNAAIYGAFIVLLYTIPISVIIGLTWFLGGGSVTADIFNWLATHWLPNLIFFVVFMTFAASFFGAFEITLPSSWMNNTDKKSDTKSLGGIFFLALTLVLVSFSCTGPIVGTVLIKSTQGEVWTPMITMLAFSIAFALPFTLLALFPGLLKKLPKSGNWLSSVKKVLGFIEVALGLKFLSVADQTYHWGILPRPVYIGIWIIVFVSMALYLLGIYHFKDESKPKKLSATRIIIGIISLAFSAYLTTGLFGAPLKAISGYLPPMESAQNEFPLGLKSYPTIEEGLARAQKEGKRVFVDITGYGCVNCREMEARVWSDPRVMQILKEQYVIVALYNDDKTKLPEKDWVTTEDGKVLKDVGRKNSYIARQRFGVNAQPNYAILDQDGNQVGPVYGYNLKVEDFITFLLTPEEE